MLGVRKKTIGGEQKIIYDVIADHPEHGRITIAELFVTKRGKELYIEEILPVPAPGNLDVIRPSQYIQATGPNEAGPTAIRSIWRQLIKDNPGVEKVSAVRITGARAGPAAKEPGASGSTFLEVNPFTQNLRKAKKPPTVREEMRERRRQQPASQEEIDRILRSLRIRGL